LTSLSLNPDHEQELDRAQSEAKQAFLRAKRIVDVSRALLLKQAGAPAGSERREQPTAQVPPPAAGE
jgi:hypothetical protein